MFGILIQMIKTSNVFYVRKAFKAIAIVGTIYVVGVSIYNIIYYIPRIESDIQETKDSTNRSIQTSRRSIANSLESYMIERRLDVEENNSAFDMCYDCNITFSL